MYPTDLRYYKEHQWARTEGEGIATVGITFFAQEQLGDVVFVDVPQVGSRVEQFGKFGEVESVKSVSDLFSPVSGEIVEINLRLSDSPELVNQDPYGEGWIFRAKMTDLADTDRLMTAAQYGEAVKEAR